MNQITTTLLAALTTFSLTTSQSFDDDWQPIPKLGANNTKPSPTAHRAYLEAIRRTAAMVGNFEARALAAKYGLNILNVTWEDTARYKNSAVGPNISDMTIQVAVEDPLTRHLSVTLMPVIRFPNFSDETCDLDPRDFTLLVGNEKGRPLQRVSLYEFLVDPAKFLTNPNSWKSRKKTLIAERDSKVLVSAQACFLPVPQQGLATFNPVVFNYQSVSGDPAVLTILATREGTSVTIIDNKRDAFHVGYTWGQRLFHNANGMRASLTGQRLTDFNADPSNATAPGRNQSGLNMVLLIQVPLKQKYPMRCEDGGVSYFGYGAAGGFGGNEKAVRAGSDVEAAVIGHGEIEGPFTEIDNLNIERDPRFPVRVTVQFYKATSNGIVNDADMKTIKEEIDRVYSLSDHVGSLVTGGQTGRVTEYYGSKIQPPSWWEEFWRRYEQNMGESRWEAIDRLKRLIGKNYQTRPVCELYLRDVLRRR